MANGHTTHWQNARMAYLEQGRLDEKNDDDLVGRRIMRGLGFTRATKAIYQVEQRVLGNVRGDEPLWVRSKRLFVSMLMLSPKWQYLARRWKPEIRHVKNASEVRDILATQEYTMEGDLPLIFTRIVGTNASYVVTLWGQDELAILKPPYEVVFCAGIASNLRCVIQDTIDFVEQFGPYDIGVLE